MEAIFKKVLSDIKPIDKTLKDTAREKIDLINSLLKEHGIKAKAVAGGSVAKDTYLKNDFDVDLFVAFSTDYVDQDISKLLYNAIKSLKPELVHGSRDYFHIDEKGIIFEIIPVLDVKEAGEARNVTDMSIYHVKWAKKILQKDPKLRDDIRLAKAFCKGIGVYGAESYIRGFSGHTLDILIAYYGSFIKLLRGAANWHKGIIIDINQAHKGNALKTLNKAKVLSPLILIDPVDPMRNASASLDNEKFNRFITSAKEFIENPDLMFFVQKKFSINDILRKGKEHKTFILQATPLKGKTDVSGAKLLKVFQIIEKKIKLNDFIILEDDWSWNKDTKAFLWYILDEKPLSRFKEHIGPPLKARAHAEEFRKKHSKCVEKNGRLYATVKREYTQPEALIDHLLTEESSILERVKSIKRVIPK